MLKRWRTVCNALEDLADPGFKLHTFCPRGKLVLTGEQEGMDVASSDTG